MAGTADGAISTPDVDIFLSSDGGQTFPVILATATPYDGSFTFTVPPVATTTARVMVRGSGNIFLDINDADITLVVDGSPCDASASFVSPEEEISAPAGDPSLNLNLSPNYRDQLSSPFKITLDATDGSGNCAAINFGGYLKAVIVASGSGAPVTFSASKSNFSGNFIANASLFDPPYVDDCTGYLGGTATFTRNPEDGITISNKSFTLILVSGGQYEIVGYGIGNGATGDIEVTHSGGTLFTATPSPGNGFAYTYDIAEETTGKLVAFDPDGYLSDAARYSSGSYSVFGISFADGVDLDPYLGGSRQLLDADAAAGHICAVSSANGVTVSVSELILRVELALFTGRREFGTNLLEWVTEAEVGTELYNVQRRSAGGADWLTVSPTATSPPAPTTIVYRSWISTGIRSTAR